MSEDVLKVDCCEHGKRNASVVCRHLLNEKSVSLDFFENSSVSGDYQAWCGKCEEFFLAEEAMTEKFREFTDAAIVCEECYFSIKAIHTK